MSKSDSPEVDRIVGEKVKGTKKPRGSKSSKSVSTTTPQTKENIEFITKVSKKTRLLSHKSVGSLQQDVVVSRTILNLMAKDLVVFYSLLDRAAKGSEHSKEIENLLDLLSQVGRGIAEKTHVIAKRVLSQKMMDLQGVEAVTTQITSQLSLLSTLLGQLHYEEERETISSILATQSEVQQQLQGFYQDQLTRLVEIEEAFHPSGRVRVGTGRGGKKTVRYM